MSSEDLLRVDKGKGRATSPEPSEETPLLASSSRTSSSDLEPAQPHRRTCRSVFTTVFLVLLSFSLVLVLLLVFLAWTYAAEASHVSEDEIIQRALVLRGPDSINVLNITDGGDIWVEVGGHIGVDAGAIIGVKEMGDENVFRDVWKAIGRWGIRRLDDVSVQLSTIDIASIHDPDTPLASIELPPLQLPLNADPPKDSSWLTPVTIPVLVRPSQNGTLWLDFARECWRQGYVAAHASVAHVAVAGGVLNNKSWRSALKIERSDIDVSVRHKIPVLPGLPPPGRGAAFPSLSDLVTLLDFGVHTQPSRLFIDALATFVNPAPPDITFTSPRLPFTVSLPHPNTTAMVPIATVTSDPFALTHPNITLKLTGHVVPLPANSTPALSALVSNYLSAESSPIQISTPLIRGLALDTVFPAPATRPHILRNVTIKDMKIHALGTSILASGTVLARVVLPPGLSVDLHVSRVLPDVLVFDGEIPNGGEGMRDISAPSPPFPDPLPEHAFAHIRPEDWLPSTSGPGEPEDGESAGSVTLVQAQLVDVPLEVLPGRQREFSNFVSKVIFGTKGAVAGVQGVAAVTVHVEGLPIKGQPGKDAGMELTGLPFQGSVRVGKKGL
ncbi:hypothetical protein OF83DRAFT_1117182 [Amylostereum chailletii]|nr:hypothetical protein OF83DRAFT_1117182 [Amylostereum chailletii]